MAQHIVLSNLGESAVSAEEFKGAFRRHAAGVAIISGDDGSGPVSITVSSVFSVSAEPPALVFSLSSTASATPHLLKAGRVVVHLLTPNNLALAKLAAAHGADRFGADVSWHRLPSGEPVYSDVECWLRGDIVEEIQVGGSTLVVVHVLEVRVPGSETPNDALLYHDRTWARLSAESYITD
ncbi:MAG TPA: flavin reductase family protein [Microbacteriaceae bacterium]|nr:flavin reductase family protein [Microbacteriaceae bacterium]